jgi:hypothetical protein
LTQLSGQSEDRSYAFWTEGVGHFPITCDGVNVDFVTCDVTVHIVSHWQQGDWKWETDQVKWVATSTSGSGEVFQGNELDKIVATDQGFVGTWRGNIKGDMGDLYHITVAVSWDGVIWSWSLVEAKCN